MIWSSTSPDGNQSVRANRALMAANTTYTETTMNVDHFWNIATKDGHHKQVQMPKTETGGVPSDPSITTAMDGLIYLKKKISDEAADQQDVQPFFMNETGGGPTAHIMQLLGIRAMGVFDQTTSNGAVTLQYGHRCTVARSSKGIYVATFFSALPSDNYLVLGGGISKIGDSGTSLPCVFQLPAATTLATKTIAAVTFLTTTSTAQSAVQDPLQTWFVVFGG